MISWEVLAEAQIEIVDDGGEIEDRVRIVGAGEVGLATTGRCEFQTVLPECGADVVFVLRDRTFFMQAKSSGMLHVNGKELGRARMPIERELIAHVTAMHRRVRVKMFLLSTASLSSTEGAVIRMKPTPLEAWSTRAAARGARKVSEHLARLRANGSIDEDGKLLVPLPADMNPDSSTDV